MVENTEQPVTEETQKEGLIARKFREARERKIADYEDVSLIYESMKNPKLGDLYKKWVDDADVVANAASLGRESPQVRKVLTKAMGRLSGIAISSLVAPTDLVIDAITWFPRRFGLKHFIPTKMLSRSTMGISEMIKARALVTSGVRLGVKGVFEAGKLPGKIVGEPVKFVVKGVAKGAGEVAKSAFHGFPEVRAPIVAAKRKAERIAKGILHPQKA